MIQNNDEYFTLNNNNNNNNKNNNINNDNNNKDGNQPNIEFQNNNDIKYQNYIDEQNQDDIDLNNSKNNSSFNSYYEHSCSQKDYYFSNNQNQSNQNNQNKNESIYNSPKIRDEKAHYERYNNLYNLLYDFLKWELIIENIKQTLSSQSDVNTKIIFDIFDIKKRNLISLSDITRTLKNFGMNVSFEDTKYIFLRNNKKIKEKYKFDEFCEIFLSNNGKKRQEINDRILNDNYPGELSEKTKNIICLLFQKIIEGERSNEFYRNNLAMVPNASGFDLFNLMKKNYSVGISKEDIDHFLGSRGKMFYNNETELIMKKLDKNKDGIIDYTEFLSEITPKFVF
jgi:Ca2+-binding EF-hand superfamily protein